MNYFYDCEFKEDGKIIDLISIGMVAEDGREYYAVSNEFDTRRVARDEWLMNNVMTSIGHETFLVSDGQGMPVVMDLYITDPAAKSKSEIARDIFDLLRQDSDPQLWAWYSAYDHVCLAQLWGRMVNMPDSVPMWTNDIKTLIGEVERRNGRLGVKMPQQPAGVHNALEDARFNVVRFNYLMNLLEQSGVQ